MFSFRPHARPRGRQALPRVDRDPPEDRWPPHGLTACVSRCFKRTDRCMAGSRPSTKGWRRRAAVAARGPCGFALAEPPTRPGPLARPLGPPVSAGLPEAGGSGRPSASSRNPPLGAASPVSRANFPLLCPSAPSLCHLTPRGGRAGVTSLQRTVLPLKWG